MSAETRTFMVEAQIGQRLDQALRQEWPDLSRAQWQKLLKEKQIKVDGQLAKASLRLEGGETVTAVIPTPQTTDLIAEAIPLTIQYEDEALLVINKPAGMVVHPAAGHDSGTLVNAILHHCPDLPGIGGEKRPGIVHRLDKDTSGLIVVAKNDQSLRHLQAQFKARTVQKTYLALVEGQVQPAKAIIDAAIGRDPRQRKRMAVISPNRTSAQSRPAQTSYHVQTAYEAHNLVACHPRTGRTHQIRVHMAYIGHPLVGDAVYGRRKQTINLDRHFLHAAELTFVHPVSEEEMTFTCELPPELTAVLDTLTPQP